MVENNKIKIHILRCGTIHLTESMAYKKHGLLPGKRIELPVNVYLIEHPVHGRLLVDTGLSYDCRSIMPGHLLNFYEPEIELKDTAAMQLAAMGIAPGDIDCLLITHNHVDHTCALKDFAGKAKRIIMPEQEYFWSCRTVYKRQQVWETWMPYADIIERPFYYGCAQGPDGRGFDLFKDDSVLCISCPGHTEGMMAIMINKSPSGRFAYAGNGMYGGPFAVIASDAAFSGRNIDDLVVPGYGFAPQYQLKGLKWLKKMKEDPMCVGILCSHDPDMTGRTIEF